MQLNKGDIIKSEESYFAVFCVMLSVVYVNPVTNIGNQPCYELEDVLKYYRKIEIIGGH